MYLSQPEITGKLSREKDSSQILEGRGGGKGIPVKGNRQSKGFVQKVQKVRSSFGEHSGIYKSFLHALDLMGKTSSTFLTGEDTEAHTRPGI